MAHGELIDKPRKKAKQVTGNKAKLKTLADLKKVNQRLDEVRKVDENRFKKIDKMFTQRRKLEEKLGID